SSSRSASMPGSNPFKSASLLRLKIPPSSSKRRDRALSRAAAAVSELFQGRAVEIAFRPSLTALRARLLSCQPKGQPVHAATYLRNRRVILNAALLDDPHEFARILCHELFHFAWVRLGNPMRGSWEAVLQKELQAHARGELGWSAEVRKENLADADLRCRTRRWREYVCESFCDSAACFHLNLDGHPELTLAGRYRRRRAAWFRKQQLLGSERISI
ncbi:MAG: hypothetical protein ACRD9L_02315, partial [Bryobacteraceae bacterium]